jgi:hypothetical protein
MRNTESSFNAHCTSCGWKQTIIAQNRDAAKEAAFTEHDRTQLRGAVSKCSDEAARIEVLPFGDAVAQV